MKKIYFLSFFILIIFFGIWIWLFGFGGYWKIFNWLKYHPRHSRFKVVLDYPIFQKFPRTIKIFDPFFPDYWRTKITLPIYHLEIDPENLAFLNQNLPRPYSSSGLGEEFRQSVNAILKSDKENISVKIRYRGDTFTHWSEPKKSWRIKKENGEIINLILPEDRGLFVEALANYRAKKLGLMHQNNDFIWLKVNNQNMGVYYQTGHWDEFWLKSQNKPISDLLGENDYETGSNLYANVWDGVQNWKYYVTRPDKNFPNSLYLQKFLNIVKNTPDENLFDELSQVVDIDSLVRWQVHATLMGNQHTNDTHNWRIYLDPETKKFEFIPVDSAFQSLDYIGNERNLLATRILENPRLKQMHDEILREYIKDDEQLQDDLKYWDNLENKLAPFLYQDKIKHISNLGIKQILDDDQFISQRIQYLREMYTGT